MTFIPQDIIVCIAVSFATGLYVGAFVQRRRDVKAFKLEKKIDEVVREQPDQMKMLKTFQRDEGETKNEKVKS